jgi:quercetin dioxygenase-like cupin family protein
MEKGHCCSLQYHNEKHETIYVLSGILKIQYSPLGEYPNGCYEKVFLKKGGFWVLLPKIIHRVYALEDCVYLESSTSQMDDVVRLEDAYGRIS